MNRILLAVTIWAVGAVGFLAARQSASQLQHQAQSLSKAWLAETQRLAAAQSERIALTEHIRELKQTLRAPSPSENELWSALQTNRADRLPPELRERLFEELGFNWQASEDFIVVSKAAVRAIQMRAIHRGKLTDMAAAVLAMTPEERGRVEGALEHVQSDLRDWVLNHVQRGEPKDDVVGYYFLPGDPAMSQSVSNWFTDLSAAVSHALGQQRAELVLPSARLWMSLVRLGEPVTIIVRRSPEGNGPRLKGQFWFGTQGPDRNYNRPFDLSKDSDFMSDYGKFPVPFRFIFPNGWADVVEREGLELPAEPPKK